MKKALTFRLIALMLAACMMLTFIIAATLPEEGLDNPDEVTPAAEGTLPEPGDPDDEEEPDDPKDEEDPDDQSGYASASTQSLMLPFNPFGPFGDDDDFDTPLALFDSIVPFAAIEGVNAPLDFNADPDPRSGDTWDWDGETLILNGLDMTVSATHAIIMAEDSKIILNGNNIINNDGGDGIYLHDYEGGLDISGGGTLTINSLEDGIYVYGDLSITNVTIIINNTDGESYGISAGVEGTSIFTITGSTVNILKAEIGIEGPSLSITNSTVSMSNIGDVGINVYEGNASIEDSTVTINNAGEHGIVAQGGGEPREVTIEGSSTVVNVTAGGMGIISDHVEINGGYVMASGGTAPSGSPYTSEQAYGILAWGDDTLIISGGTVVAIGGDNALDFQPGKFTLPTVTYWWRISTANPAVAPSGSYTVSTTAPYVWSDTHTGVEITTINPATQGTPGTTPNTTPRSPRMGDPITGILTTFLALGTGGAALSGIRAINSKRKK